MVKRTQTPSTTKSTNFGGVWKLILMPDAGDNGLKEINDFSII